MKSYKQTNIALGGEARLVIVSDKGDQYNLNILKELWNQIYSFEKRFSRFLPYSELSTFNRNSGTKQFISPEFHDILAAAIKISYETKQLFNPFLLPAIQKAGYIKSFVAGTENDKHDDYSERIVVGIDKLELTKDWARIPFGTAIDLGGCGKGYLADQLAVWLIGKVEGFSVSLDGDIVCAGTDENNSNWSILIQNISKNNNDIIGEIIMPREISAVASSGIISKQGIRNGKKWHHIIDPITLNPAETDVELVTIMHKECLYADVLASCSVILGSKKSVSFLRNQKIKDCLFQLINKKTLLSGKTIKLY